VRKESATIMAVFPSPNEVMAILVQVLAEDCIHSPSFFIVFMWIRKPM